LRAYADLGDLPEDERIKVIAATAAAGEIVGFVVDDNPKADRYIKKLGAYPVRVIDRMAGPVKNTILVRVGPKES
jgi:hypothetical protein